MPYIKQDQRDQLDLFIDDLSTALRDSDDTAGNLNYTITRLCHEYINEHGLNYASINTLIGMLECAKIELYSRVAVPYEAKKSHENGDLLPEESTK